MLGQAKLQELEKAGYGLLPPPHEPSPGHGDLMVLLRDRPADTLFDAESIHVRVRNWDGTVHWTTFEADTPFPETRSVCPGKVVVRGRSGRKVTFFVFGGTLEATPLPDETLYSLRSDAPILSLTMQSHSVDTQLAVDVEGILAEELAKKGWDDQTYWQSMMEIEPLQLYLACINMILDRHQRSAALHQGHHQYYATLREEREQLARAGKWPETVPTLEELLP